MSNHQKGHGFYDLSQRTVDVLWQDCHEAHIALRNAILQARRSDGVIEFELDIPQLFLLYGQALQGEDVHQLTEDKLHRLEQFLLTNLYRQLKYVDVREYDPETDEDHDGYYV